MVKEPILQESKDRFVIFPVKHHDIWDWYKKMEKGFWTTEEIDLHLDLNDWNHKLNPDERYFIKHILAFLVASERMVHENPAKSFVNEVQYAEAKFFYSFQIMMENIHSETYSLLLDTYVNDQREKNHLFKDLGKFPVIQKKRIWAEKWLESHSFAERLVAFAALERIFFSGAFCSLFWLKQRELMPGLSFSNELISRDEKIHGNFAVHLHNEHLVNKLPKERICEIIIDALDIEKELYTRSLPVSLIGIKTELMTQYLEFVTDNLLMQFNCEKEYGVSIPFNFMNKINTNSRTDLFEKRVNEYQKKTTINKDEDPNEIS